MAIYYLDADDEITSAATRIRDSSDTRIALVLTAGSRVATSRINFMLLAREARRRNKSLAIVTADPSTQSVARSADLDVYASVNEYERASSARASNAATVAAGGSAKAAETTEALDELARTVGSRSGGTLVAAGGPGTGSSGGALVRKPAGSPSRTVASGREGRSRVPWPAVAAALALAIVLVGGGLFFIYPSATITVQLQQEPVGPLALTVTVDPSATTVDDATATVPGLSKAFPVEASGTYTATGQHIDDTAATGTVTFSSINTVFSVPVIAGTQVSTAGGVAFVTNKTVTVPVADFGTGTKGTVQVGVTAVIKGTAGNVAAGTITRLPSDLAAAKVTVTNPQPTSGGTHTVTPEIQQADVDLAANDLLDQLDAQFKDAMAAPGAHPAGADLFTDTARMGVAVCNPDPATLVGQNVDTFDLACTATGTATIADLSNVKTLAERRIKALVGAGYSLVDSSVQTDLGTPAVRDGALVVPVTARAAQVRKISADELRSAIVGKSLSDAEAYLKKFGKTTISMSPGWADTMPAFDFRIDVRLVVPPSAAPSASPTASPQGETPTARPTVRRTAEPGSPSPSETPGAETPTPTPSGPTESGSPGTTPTPSTSPTAKPSSTPSPSPSPTP